jgi:hypothetical protein
VAEHTLLVAFDELEQYGATAAFLDQFVPGTVELQVTTAGALGTMQFAWRRRGETSWNAPILSDAGATWAKRISPAFVDLVFVDGAYVVPATDVPSYLVSTSGAVTPVGTAISAVTATRWDVRQTTGQAATDKALSRMAPKVVPPLSAWGSDLKAAAAALWIYELKTLVGMSPGNAGTGDENVRLRALDAEDWLRGVGRGDVKPQNLVDSSSGGKGGGLLVYPVSNPPRGW